MLLAISPRDDEQFTVPAPAHLSLCPSALPTAKDKVKFVNVGPTRTHGRPSVANDLGIQHPGNPHAKQHCRKQTGNPSR